MYISITTIVIIITINVTYVIVHFVLGRVVPSLGAKETAKLMSRGLGPDWQRAAASASIQTVVCGIRRGVALASTGNQSTVSHRKMYM